jgi:hypothetical protein
MFYMISYRSLLNSVHFVVIFSCILNFNFGVLFKLISIYINGIRLVGSINGLNGTLIIIIYMYECWKV